MTNVQAALGVAQMEELEEFIGALPQIEKRGGEYVVLLETYKGKYEFTLKGEKR